MSIAPTTAMPPSLARVTAARQILARNLSGQVGSDPRIARVIPAIVAELEPHLRADAPQSADEPVESVLTNCEHRILALAAEGYTNDRIAAELGKATDTVKTHLRRLYRKLGARDRAHAVMLAMRMGILQ